MRTGHWLLAGFGMAAVGLVGVAGLQRAPVRPPIDAIPSAGRVAVRVGDRIQFAVAAEQAVDLTWSLDDRVVARDAAWSYAPGAAEAGQRTVSVAVTGDDGRRLARSWQVAVNARTPPDLVELDPPAGPVRVSPGDAMRFRCRASLVAARAADRLHFEWTVDDDIVLHEERPALDGYSALPLRRLRPGLHQVAVRVGEGTRTATRAEWTVEVTHRRVPPPAGPAEPAVAESRTLDDAVARMAIAALLAPPPAASPPPAKPAPARVEAPPPPEAKQPPPEVKHPPAERALPAAPRVPDPPPVPARVVLAAPPVVPIPEPGQAASGEPVIERIEVSTAPRVAVRLHLSAPAVTRAQTLGAGHGQPHRVYLDLVGARVGPGARPVAPGTGTLLRVRAGQFDATTARVVLDLASAVRFAVRDEGRTVTVELEAPPTVVAGAVPPAPLAAATPPPPAPPPPARANAAPSSPAPAGPPPAEVVETAPPSVPADPPPVEIAAAPSAPAEVVEPPPPPAPTTPPPAEVVEPTPAPAPATPPPAEIVEPTPAPAAPPPAEIVEPTPAPVSPPPVEVAVTPAADALASMPLPATPPPAMVAATIPPAAPAEIVPPGPPPSDVEAARQGETAARPPEPSQMTPAPEPAGPPPAAQETTPPAPPSVATVPPAAMPVVVLDPGHGGRDPGAAGVGGVLEKDVVLELAHRLAVQLATRLPVTVVMTRSDDSFLPIDDRLAVAGDGATIFLSLHANACHDPSPRGLEVFYGGGRIRSASAGAMDRRAALLGRCLHRALEARLGPVRHDPLPGSFGVLVRNPAPSALIEIGYLTHPGDAAQTQDAGYQNLLAEALVEGVEAFLRAAAPPL